MKISLVGPASKHSHSGNKTTAVRWAQILRDLGHRVHLAAEYDGEEADLLIAIHAWRSAPSIDAFHSRHPQRPLVVLLAGTDIYRFQHSHRDIVCRSMRQATALVGLHDLVHRSIPKRFAGKLSIIHQSSLPVGITTERSKRHFDVCVIGNLRAEKDPLRAALAACQVPQGSRLRVIHAGRADDKSWQEAAEREMQHNRRYLWKGAVARWQVRRIYARAHLMVLSSLMEGGANVISEAVAAGLPVLASHIEGNVGLLGDGYAGYFPVKDTAALAAMLARAEADAPFLERLWRQCRARAHLFKPARERNAWRGLLARILHEFH